MKKTLFSKMLLTILMIALAASLSACGGSAAPTATAESESVESVVEESKPEESSEAASSEESSEESVAEEPAQEEAEEKLVPEELLGDLTETSYVNEYFGFRFDAPDDWYILTRDEAAMITGLTTENIDDEDLVAMLESDGYVTDLYVMETTPAIEGMDAYNNVNVTIQDIGKLYGAILNEKRLAEMSMEQVKGGLESLGMTDISTEVGEAEFLGAKRVAATISSKMDGNAMYQKQIYIKKGSAVACVTATASGEDKTDDIFAMFRDSADAPAEKESEEESAEESAEEAKEEAAAGAAVDASAIADAPLSSGVMLIDGDLFTMGSGLNDIQNWSITPEDEEKYKEYSLNPWTTSGGAMGLYKDSFGTDFTSFHVMASLMNASDSPIAYLDGAIDYLSIPGINRADSVPEVILPGGLTLKSTEEDFRAAYGEPSYEYEDEETEFRSVHFEDGEVEIQLTWVKGEISEITMTI